MVVEHEMDGEAGGDTRVDVLEEAEELLMAMPTLALGEDGAALNVEAANSVVVACPRRAIAVEV
jgi:hypothetical protein